MKSKGAYGHISAILTIIIWGTTFISTKILLKDFLPIEILFFRFSIGYVTLLLIKPGKLKITERKQEIYFILAGLCGVTLYFLLENIALTYSLASNVGVIVSISPFFIGIFSLLFLKGEKLKPQFFIGFIVAIIGIFLIAFNGKMVLKLNPLGDLLAVLAPIAWAFYSVLMKKIGEFHYNTIQTTRKIFFYGIIFMIPALFIFDFKFGLNRFTHSTELFNILYLGFGASALCFVTWNYAVKIIGVVKTSVYIYAVPVITIVMSAIILHDKISLVALLGTALTLLGLFISEGYFSSFSRKNKK